MSTIAGEIRLPVRSVSDAPFLVSTVGLDELYIVDSDEPLLCVTSPAGVLNVKQMTGPIVFPGRFAGGTKIEFREFKGPFLYAITAESGGKAELICVAVADGVPVEKTRVMLTITGPRPPPIPGPVPPGPEPVPPKPDPAPQPVAKTVSIAIVEDTMNRTPETAIMLNQLVSWSEYQDAGHQYRLYDHTTSEPRGKLAVQELGVGVSGIVVRDRATSKVIHKGAIPATFEELKSLVGRLTGG